jgi:hypothetical protein
VKGLPLRNGAVYFARQRRWTPRPASSENEVERPGQVDSKMRRIDEPARVRGY